MLIVHDHPCPPTKVDHAPIAETFTYDCKCGKLMIVENCDKGIDTVFGKEMFMTLASGEKVRPISVEF